MLCRAFIDKKLNIPLSVVHSSFRRLLEQKLSNIPSAARCLKEHHASFKPPHIRFVCRILQLEEAAFSCLWSYTLDVHWFCFCACWWPGDLYPAGWAGERVEQVPASHPIKQLYKNIQNKWNLWARLCPLSMALCFIPRTPCPVQTSTLYTGWGRWY